MTADLTCRSCPSFYDSPTPLDHGIGFCTDKQLWVSVPENHWCLLHPQRAIVYAVALDKARFAAWPDRTKIPGTWSCEEEATLSNFDAAIQRVKEMGL